MRTQEQRSERALRWKHASSPLVSPIFCTTRSWEAEGMRLSKRSGQRKVKAILENGMEKIARGLTERLLDRVRTYLSQL